MRNALTFRNNEMSQNFALEKKENKAGSFVGEFKQTLKIQRKFFEKSLVRAAFVEKCFRKQL